MTPPCIFQHTNNLHCSMQFQYLISILSICLSGCGLWIGYTGWAYQGTSQMKLMNAWNMFTGMIWKHKKLLAKHYCRDDFIKYCLGTGNGVRTAYLLLVAIRLKIVMTQPWVSASSVCMVSMSAQVSLFRWEELFCL